MYEVRRGLLDDLATLNELKFAKDDAPEIVTRIAQYELAYKMQASVPELTDFSTLVCHHSAAACAGELRPGGHSAGIVRVQLPDGSAAGRAGVRFVQCFHAGWDHHRNLNTQFEIQCRDTDQPSAALVKDLKQRGLLDDTLVIWGGGPRGCPRPHPVLPRRHQRQENARPRPSPLRLHHLAGRGGVKRGFSYGESDDFAYNPAKDPVHVHDFQATVMHLLGIDHERLTYKFQGRYFRLTDVHGRVVNEILA